MLLRVLNYWAAPFGSEEYELTNYGVRGTDFTIGSANNPRLTQAGTADALPWNQIVAAPPVLYSPNDTSMPARYQDNQKTMAAAGVEDPSLGLFSETDARKGASLLQNFADGVIDIVTGRRPFSDFDGILKTWLEAGGTQIEQEYAAAYTAAKN
jgi:putative aldouronate transport system substrate-binding protein